MSIQISALAFQSARRAALAAFAGASVLALTALAPSAASAQTYGSDTVVAQDGSPSVDYVRYRHSRGTYSGYRSYRNAYGSYGGSYGSYGGGGYGYGYGDNSRNQTW